MLERLRLELSTHPYAMRDTGIDTAERREGGRYGETRLRVCCKVMGVWKQGKTCQGSTVLYIPVARVKAAPMLPVEEAAAEAAAAAAAAVSW